MTKRLRKTLLVITIILAMLLTGCTSTKNSASTATGVTTTPTASTDTSTDIATTVSSTTSQIVVNKEFTANDLEVGYEDSTATHITLDGSEIEVSGKGATTIGGVVTITKEGTYVISGTLTEGQIVVDADADKVQLVLNGTTINSSNSAPIYIKKADKVFITLVENTVNTLTDGTTYVQTDENTVDGVIFSTADLTINGQGTLNITANYKHGIVSKDDLIFTGGTYNITAVKDTINGKDCVKIKDGTFTLTAATGNGIQSKNGEDVTTGYVYISGGSITVTSCNEGIEGTAIVIDGGTIDITSSDDGFNAASGDTTATDTTTNSVSTTTGTTADKVSTTIGTSIDTTDATIAVGTTSTPATVVELAATKATSATTVSPDTNSSASIAPDGATNDVAGNMVPGGNRGNGNFGGKGDFGGDGNFGGGEMENNTDCYIAISGGTIKINASGDGIDSNGSISISGGEIKASGPVENNNAAMDYNGTAEITGGTIIVAGSLGMAQGFTETSTQYSLLNNFTSSCAAGSEITLTDADGNVIIAYTPEKAYQSVVISTPKLVSGATYTLTSGDQTAEITLSSIVTSNGESGGMNFQGQGGMTRPSRGK